MTVVIGADNPEVDDFLAHYGVKGMRWGVRKEQDSGPKITGNKTYIAKRSAQAMTIVGASAAGRILGAAGGTSVAGLGVGTIVGSFAGGVAAQKIATRAVYGNVAKKRTEAKANLDTVIPNRHPAYTTRVAKNDIDKWGPDAAQRINRSMQRGMTRLDAQHEEKKLQRNATLTAVGASIAQGMLVNRAIRVLSHPEVQSRARASAMGYAMKKGAGRAARRSPAMKLGPALQFTQPGKHSGVYNVTSLK